MLTRRNSIKAAAGVAAAATLGVASRAEAAQTVKVGISAALTGADAASAARQANGSILALMNANALNEVPGVTFTWEKFDNGTATAGQYDPAQAATNARKMVSDPSIVAAVGPQMSGDGKAMSPILSAGHLITITPSSTNPDITDPKFAAIYRPADNHAPVYFRTVTTDAYQGPNMANFFAEHLKAKKIFILDDSGAYGVGISTAFEGQAKKKGIQVLGHEKLDPKNPDYTAVLTKIKSLNPDSLYYGGVTMAGAKLAKQSYQILPNIHKGDGDGIVGSDFLTAGGFPAIEGWYATIAGPHLVGTASKAVGTFTQQFITKFKTVPDDYAVTGYDAAWVIVQAVKKLVAEKKPITRDNIRSTLLTITVDTLQGPVAFDANGDIKSRVVSVFQIREDKAKPLSDPNAQYAYIGSAPQA
jgi:branched-chain amino acid transport system substrate-binding protein